MIAYKNDMLAQYVMCFVHIHPHHPLPLVPYIFLK